MDINIKDKLAVNTFKPASASHLRLDKQLCEKCKRRCCLWVCPAKVYTMDEQGSIQIEFEACLECGTCLIACRNNAIQWNYPEGGFGVRFRYG